jgi:hypothetical protein
MVVKKLVKEFPEIFDPLDASFPERQIKGELSAPVERLPRLKKDFTKRC